MTHAPHICSAVLNIEGRHYPCTQMKHMLAGSENHDGWAHSNDEAQAIWVSDRDPISTSGQPHVVSDSEDCWCQPTVIKVPGR